MSRFINMSGEQFGQLEVLYPTNQYRGHDILWYCQCSCGDTAMVTRSDVTRKHGNTSCGCAKADRARINGSTRATHNMTNTREYKTWQSMLDRCYNHNNPDFHYYGGRGIWICRRWRWSFTNFYKDMGPRPPNTTIDRYPDNNSGYFKDNCRWATLSEQNKNRRRSRPY